MAELKDILDTAKGGIAYRGNLITTFNGCETVYYWKILHEGGIEEYELQHSDTFPSINYTKMYSIYGHGLGVNLWLYDLTDIFMNPYAVYCKENLCEFPIPTFQAVEDAAVYVINEAFAEELPTSDEVRFLREIVKQEREIVVPPDNVTWKIIERKDQLFGEI